MDASTLPASEAKPPASRRRPSSSAGSVVTSRASSTYVSAWAGACERRCPLGSRPVGPRVPVPPMHRPFLAGRLRAIRVEVVAGAARRPARPLRAPRSSVPRRGGGRAVRLASGRRRPPGRGPGRTELAALGRTRIGVQDQQLRLARARSCARRLRGRLPMPPPSAGTERPAQHRCILQQLPLIGSRASSRAAMRAWSEAGTASGGGRRPERVASRARAAPRRAASGRSRPRTAARPRRGRRCPRCASGRPGTRPPSSSPMRPRTAARRCERRERCAGRCPSRPSFEQLGPGQRRPPDRGARRPLQQGLDEIEQPGVRPLEVLEHEHGRALVGDPLEERPPCREQLLAPRRCARRGPGARAAGSIQCSLSASGTNSARLLGELPRGGLVVASSRDARRAGGPSRPAPSSRCPRRTRGAALVPEDVSTTPSMYLRNSQARRLLPMPAWPRTVTSRARRRAPLAWSWSLSSRSSSSRPTNGGSSVPLRPAPPRSATTRSARHAATGASLPCSICSPTGCRRSPRGCAHRRLTASTVPGGRRTGAATAVFTRSPATMPWPVAPR